LVQQVQQVHAVMMGRMVQMEKFPMHRVQQDLLDLKEHLVLLALQDPRDQLVQQDQQVQVLELLDQQVQLEHLVLREVLDQQDLRDRRVRQVAPVQQDRQELKVKLEQSVQRASLKSQL
jgi:hypothetical protein